MEEMIFFRVIDFFDLTNFDCFACLLCANFSNVTGDKSLMYVFVVLHRQIASDLPYHV